MRPLGAGLPNITIDGRGLTPKEALQDMWKRMQPLTQKGYNPISEVEIVDTKTKKIIERFPVTDPEFVQRTQPERGQAGTSEAKRDDHKPPTPHEYPFLARVTLEG